MRKRIAFAALAAAAVSVSLLAVPIDTLPASIPDSEFWTMTEQMSEPGGTFQSDNLVSNETTLSTVATELEKRLKPGGAYLGVGPEQNFHYIAAIRPRIAFITDIRRGNLHLQLMYKALFELAADRAEFVSRLFSKPRPAGLSAASTAAELMNAYWDVYTADETTYKANLQQILDQLTKKHGFPLSQQDRNGIENVYHSFYWFGPRITYSSRVLGTVTASGGINYAYLMTALDQDSRERSYLSTEESFSFLKTMEGRNLIIPLVGDFAGPKALRAVGTYVRERGAVVSAFYVSNVEQYLTRAGVWERFCSNVATMPLDEMSTFIRPGVGGMNTLIFRPLTNSAVGGSVPQLTVVAAGQPISVPVTAIRNALTPMSEHVKSCR